MADNTAGFSFYEKVATDAVGNIAFAYIGPGIVWVFTKFWLGAAKVLFWIAAAIAILGAAHFLFVCVAGAILWMTKRPAGRDKWVWASTAARLLEQILCLTALWLAARLLGYLR